MILMRKTGLIVGVVLWVSALPLIAQPYQTMHQGMNNWYFGNTAKALKFNRVTAVPTVANKIAPFGSGGSATASNPANSNLMFYTDGNNVYDAFNQVMPNGSGLLGNSSSNQPVAVCPVPGQANKYFIFTNTATSSAPGIIRYHVVDMAQLGNSTFPSTIPFGDLESTNNTIAGLTNRSEAMLIIPHSNGTFYWLISQQFNSNNYTVNLINVASYTGSFPASPVLGTNGIGLAMNASHFAAFGNRIAVAPSSASIDATILTFTESSATTASLALTRTITNSAVGSTNSQAIYDIEWSGDGHYVYYSVSGDAGAGIPGDVYQYDFNSPSTSLVSALPATVFRSYGLQFAPDSTIYHIYQTVNGGPFLLGKFNDPDSVAAKVNYVALPIDNTSWASTQFSAVLPLITPTINVTFTTGGNCQNTPTSFYPTVTPAADSLIWDFGDGNPPVNAWSPVHTYQNSGIFNASVTAFYQGQSQVSAPVAVNITAYALQLQLVQDTTACTFEFPPPKGTDGSFSVTATVSGGAPASPPVWSNGDTGLTLTPDSAGYYYLVISDGTCSSYAGVNVKEYGVPDQTYNVWYFGNKAGIDFNKSPAVALNDGAMNAPEGCSAMSDRNGEIIFYTDGNNVYDQTHTLIATGLGGNTFASQSALIVPVPGDETLYYIFTVQANSDYPTNTVFYSLFDLKLNSGKGGIVTTVPAPVALFNGSTERLASSGNWLIIHEYGNNSFRAYPISAAGIGEPVISSLGSDHAYNHPTLAEGYMKLGQGVLAVPLSIPGTSNAIEVFDFDNTTGILSNFRSVDLQETTAQAYGIEFSGKKMFVTLTKPGGPSFIREVYFDFQNNPVLIPPTIAANSGPFTQELGAIQQGPDGQLYIAINGSSTLGTFTVNPDTLQTSTVNFAGFALAGGTTSNLGLPSFVQQQGNAFGGPAMSIAGNCLGTPTDYIGTPTDPIDTFLWSFGDGATSVLDSGQHTYALAGTYTVTLRINNRCLIHDGLAPYDLSQSITIVAPPAAPTIPATTAICTAPVVLDADNTGTPGLTFLWSTTETTQQISVNAVGSYSVTITNASGCTSTGSTTLFDARPPVNLGPDLTVCQNSFVATLDAQNPPPSFTHVWTLDGVANGNTTPTQTVDTSTPGTDTYEVTVTNIATGCQVVENVTITINEGPHFTLTANNTTACGAATGQLSINITALTATAQPPIHTFSYFVSGPVPSSAIQQSIGVKNVGSLIGGNYSVLVQDDISRCTDSKNATVSDPTNTLNVPGITTCSTSPLAATTNANAVPVVGAFTYTVFDSGGTQVDTGSKNTAAFSTNPLAPGTYTLQINKSGCVTGVNNIGVTQLPQTTLTTVNDVCAALPTITGSGPASYSFVGTDVASTGVMQSTTATTLTLNKVPGSYSYVVTASQGGFCSISQTIPITIESAATPTITPSDPCQTQVILSATPASSVYSYQWYRNNALDLSLLGQQVTLTSADDGDQFQVELVSSVSGCAYKSTPALTASIVGPVTAGITSTQACDDGSAFTITAITSATSPTYTWSRDIGGGFIVIANETNATTSQTTAGAYKVKVEQGVCSAEASISLFKLPLPIGALPNRAIICDDPDNVDPSTNHVDLDPGAFVSYAWFVKQTEGSPEVDLGINTQVYTADRKAYYYRVELTNTFGCSASDYTEVINDCVPKVVAPNAFRPASNNEPNKAFDISGFFIENEGFKLFIYNRWGEMVFQTSDLTLDPDCKCYRLGQKWNGGYNNNAGNPLPSGVYAYVIHYISAYRPDDGTLEKRGGIMLLR